MLNIFDITILLFAASTSIFSVSMIAHVQKCLEWFDKIKILSIFIVFPLLFFYAGTSITAYVRSLFPEMGIWVVITFLLILGVRYIWKAFKMKPENRVFDYTQWRVLIGLSIAIGMDYLILGLGFNFIDYDPQMVLLLLVLLAMFATLLGLILGKKTGKFEWGNRMLYLGGLLFVGITIKVLVQLMELI